MRDNFFSELVYFDKWQLSPAVIGRLAEYCSSPAFTPEAVSHSSVAAAHVCQWLRALHSYVEKHGELRPLMDRLNAVEQQRKQVDCNSSANYFSFEAFSIFHKKSQSECRFFLVLVISRVIGDKVFKLSLIHI